MHRWYTSAVGTLQRYAVRVEQRRAELDDALARFVEVCRTAPGIRAVYVFGSMSSGHVGPTSDLDLLVVRDTDVEYRDRGDDLRRLARLGVRIDLIVVTPQEYRERLPTTSFGRTILETARCVHAA